MKKVIYILTIIIFFTGINACKKIDAPLAEYAQYGVLREAYPLKDTISVNLRKGDSTAIETNLGNMWIKITYIYVSCYKGKLNSTCPDGGISQTFELKISNQKIIQGFGFDAYPKENALVREIILGCTETKTYQFVRTIGNMNVYFRNIYPNPTSKAEYDKLIANNGFRTTMTFQKVCR